MKPQLVPEESAVGRVKSSVVEPTFLKLTRQVPDKIGLGGLYTMVRNLAEALQADGVFVGEFTLNSVTRMTILAAAPESELANPPFALAGSACAGIAVTGHPVLCRMNALDRFPADPLLARLRAEACIAVPLKDTSGRPIGAMLAAYRLPVASFRAAQSILGVFAPRAAAELLRKQEKDGICKSEERYHAFVNRSEDGLWCVEFHQPIPTDLPPKKQLALVYRHSYYSECNDAAAKLLGLSASAEVVGRHTVDVLSKNAVRKAFLELIRSAYRFTTSETARPLPDGRRHFVLRSQLGIVEDGMLRRVWGVTRDITDFKQAQRSLDASKRHMIDLLESIQLFAVVLDPSGAIEACNNYFTELTDWRLEDLKGKNWFELTVPPEERAGLQEKFAVQLASPRKPIHFESTLLGPSGRRWHVAWDSTALRDDKLNVNAVANIGRDITQEKAVESHLRQAQRVESIGRLAGGIAHDFNNLLAVIGGYASHLLDQHTPGDPEHPELSEIRNAVEIAAQLTQQLLTFSRRRTTNPEALNLNRIVERDCSMLRRTLGKNIDLVTRLDPSLGIVNLDPVEMSQVLLNLALNARDAMPGGGALTIVSSNVTISDGQGSGASAVPAGQYVQLTVADTGTGMTKEVLDRLFEPFFTTKEEGKGTGLGLSITSRIVKQSGGHVRVESAPGRGTSIRIFLPRT